jgi:hypothetical protein
MRKRLLLAALVVLAAIAPALSAQTRHYVFFGFEREKIHTDSLFLNTRAAEGAQILYSWRTLERGKGEYDFSTIRDDLAFLQSQGKRLWIQLQDVSFSPVRKHVPQYLLDDPAYHGGAAQDYEAKDDNDSIVVAGGWVARRWDPAVQERFRALLDALGREFDGKIEGINLPETAIGFGSTGKYFPQGFTRDSYRAAVVTNFKALKRAFPKSVAMQYANFMPGEWRPYEDKGYLSGIYDSAKVYRVAVGGPDLMPSRPGQMKSSYPLIRDAAGIVPTGVAVQDGNLEEINPATGKKVTAAELIAFAKDYLKLDYIFWGTQEPFYSTDVIPTLRR